MEKKSQWAQILVFVGFITLFFFLNLISPDTAFSEQENRYLQQRPEFTFSSLFSGKYTSSFETYATDQFKFRDIWTSFKARCELLVGKNENNGIYLCGGDTLIKGFTAPDTDTLNEKISSVNALSENAGVPVYFSLVPDKSQLYAGMLPKNAPNDSEKDVIDYCYSRTTAGTIDVFSPLAEHAGDAIFYRTDHHWTSLGAYFCYTAIADAMSFPVNEIGHYSIESVSSDFYGTMWSSSGFSWILPDRMDIFVSPPEALAVTNYPEGQPVEGTLYDDSYLEKKDKYSFFLGGNTPLQQIVTGAADAPSLLIIRDSFADCLVPFLLEDFSEIHLIDLRYYRASLSDYIRENGIDEVLVIYSVSDFCTDTNIFLLGR